MLIYSTVKSTRLHYACSIVLRDYAAVWSLTNDLDVFSKFEGPKIFYSTPVKGSSGFVIVGYDDRMWNDQVKLIFPDIGQKNDLPTLFADDSAFGFDIFSACFYLVSRYEEYLPFEGDRLGRFRPVDSYLYALKGYRRPLVDLWILEFRRWLMEHWPHMKFNDTVFEAVSTIDVDSAFAYRYKGMKRTLGGIAKDVVHLRLRNLKNRLFSLARLKNDVYDTYDYILEKQARHLTKGIFFFLLADLGEMDKNVTHRSKKLRALIRDLASNHEVGIHPGVASSKNEALLAVEKKRLETITGKPCLLSRQHYLMLALPHTFQALIRQGISEDYTMGFSDDVGFRAGTARSFHWFDLEKNKETTLVIHPFAVMDTTLNKYLGLSPHEAIRLSLEMIREVRAVQGTFVSLWHNEALSEADGWRGWREVWEATLSAGQL